MEKNFTFDFGALLRPTVNSNNNEKTHKSRPTQFDSVAVGTFQRLQKNIKNRKSNRLTVFDSIRNLPSEEKAVPDLKEAKIEHRRQQLEKWKQEKEKKKKEAAAQKKKPFVAGVAHAPLKFVPPPPPPKPSTSGRVTRSQASKPRVNHTSPKQKNTKSFAPKNAPFRPPEFKNLPKLAQFGPPTKTKKRETVTFEPIQSNSTVRQTRSGTVYCKTTVKEPNTRAKTQNETKSTIGKQVRTTNNRFAKKTNEITSSSSSEQETTSKPIKRIQTPAAKKIEPKIKPITPRHLVLSSETSSSEEKPREMKPRRKSMRKSSIITVTDSPNIYGSESRSSLDEPKGQEKRLSNTINNNNEQRTKIVITDCSVVLTKSPLIKDDTDMIRTPEQKIPKSESNSEEKLRSPQTPNSSPLTPKQIELVKSSPCVTLSRGKDKARKEMKWKIQEGLIDDEVVEDEGVEYFRQQLASEVARLTARSDIWDKIAEQNNLPESVQELVLAAVGQSRLLVSQKFQQFAVLVDSAAAPQPGAPLVTTTDLRGYWDVTYMQVENIDMRFKKLEELREMNWVEQQAPVLKAVARASPAKKVTKKSAASSRLKDVIAAARRAKKQQESGETAPPTTTLAPEAPNEKTFEAGFFTVRSPVQSPVHTPCKQTLLKAVLSSEAKKTASRNSASFAMLRASILGKSGEFEGFAPLPMTPINLNATPARSILKSGNVKSATKSNKNIKLVLFDDTMGADTPLTSEEIATTRREVNDKDEEKVDDKETLVKNEEISRNDIKNTDKPKKNLVRQDAVELATPDKTRNKRRSVNTPKIEEIEEIENRTLRMSLRSRSAKTPESTKAEESSETEVKKTPKRSAKKKALQEIELVPTPKRSLRSRKSPGAQ